MTTMDNACPSLFHTYRTQGDNPNIIGKYLSGYPILAVISKLCIISECKDRFESESRASGSFITPRMSPPGVGTQRVDDRFTGPTEPGPIAMAQGAKQLG